MERIHIGSNPYRKQSYSEGTLTKGILIRIVPEGILLIRILIGILPDGVFIGILDIGMFIGMLIVRQLSGSCQAVIRNAHYCKLNGHFRPCPWILVLCMLYSIYVESCYKNLAPPLSSFPQYVSLLAWHGEALCVAAPVPNRTCVHSFSVHQMAHVVISILFWRDFA